MEVFPAPEGAVMIMILLREAMRKDEEKFELIIDE
jgi:hypothetical protein